MLLGDSCCCRYELPDEELKGRLELKIFDNVGKGVSGARPAALPPLSSSHVSCRLLVSHSINAISRVPSGY
jgi:hypothetical protein